MGQRVRGRSRRLLDLVGGVARTRRAHAVLRQLLGRDDLSASASTATKRNRRCRCRALTVEIGADPARGSPAAHAALPVGGEGILIQ